MWVFALKKERSKFHNPYPCVILQYCRWRTTATYVLRSVGQEEDACCSDPSSQRSLLLILIDVNSLYVYSKMPRYELCLILKAMQRPEIAAVLRRTVETLFERGAIVRGLDNLGERRLPYKISKHDCRHSQGGYFSIDFHSSPNIISGLLEHLERDIDVLRPTVLKKDIETSKAQCCGSSPETAKQASSH